MPYVEKQRRTCAEHLQIVRVRKRILQVRALFANVPKTNKNYTRTNNASDTIYGRACRRIGNFLQLRASPYQKWCRKRKSVIYGQLEMSRVVINRYPGREKLRTRTFRGAKVLAFYLTQKFRGTLFEIRFTSNGTRLLVICSWKITAPSPQEFRIFRRSTAIFRDFGGLITAFDHVVNYVCSHLSATRSRAFYVSRYV